MNQIAWAPTTTGNGPLLTAVKVAPSQQMDRDLFLNLLSHRIQAMLDATNDQALAVRELQEALHLAGLYPDLAAIPLEQAGNLLTWSNPAIEGRLVDLRVLPPTFPPLAETAEARRVLRNEKQDPTSGLASWVAAVTRLP